MTLFRWTHRKSDVDEFQKMAASEVKDEAKAVVKVPTDEELLAALIPARQHYQRLTDLGARGRLIEGRVLDALKAPLTEAELEHIKYTEMHQEADVDGLYS